MERAILKLYNEKEELSYYDAYPDMSVAYEHAIKLMGNKYDRLKRVSIKNVKKNQVSALYTAIDKETKENLSIEFVFEREIILIEGE